MRRDEPRQGRPQRPYKCATNKRNPGLCRNSLTISKAKVERSVVGALQRELSAPDLIARVARRLADRLRSRSSSAVLELREAREAHAKANERLRRLLDLVESGGLAASRAVSERVAAAEAERNAAASRVAAVEAHPRPTEVLPSPAAIRAYVATLDQVLTTDVERGREFLRRHVGRITLTPECNGPTPRYRASGRFVLGDPKVSEVAGAR